MPHSAFSSKSVRGQTPNHDLISMKYYHRTEHDNIHKTEYERVKGRAETATYGQVFLHGFKQRFTLLQFAYLS